jgi:phosphopantetheinyl transferase (holo-ACP synthase)
MKPTNLLIIGGAVVLGGIYLVNNSNENKEKAKALAEAQALEEAKVKEQQDADKVLEDARIKKEKEEQAREELAKRYSVTEAGVKALDTITKTNTIFTDNPVPTSTAGFQGITNKVQLRMRDVWKKNYPLIYKDIKDYYFSIYKENVNKLLDILPKMIVAKSIGNFGDKSKNIFTSQDEIYLIDNNLNREDILKNALKENYNLLFPSNSESEIPTV